MPERASIRETGVIRFQHDQLRFPDEGRDALQVELELERRLAGDMRYGSGRIIGSMISPPHPFAEQLLARYADRNVGDPGLFPETARLEREAISMLADLLHHPAARGSLVTGGTEANLLALWAAREHGEPARIEVLVPETVHVSYFKAARLLGLNLVPVPIDAVGTLRVDQVRASVGPRTLAIVAKAGSTDLGAVDAIVELGELAEKNDVHLHVDAAFGGYVLPFLNELGYPSPRFDFDVPGVRSITIDPHKMGFAGVPAGAILFRDATALSAIQTEIAYLAGGRTVQPTLVGTRSGASVVAVWGMLRLLGRSGYRELVRECMHASMSLAETVRRQRGVELAIEPVMNIVCIRPTDIPVSGLVAGLRARGWAVSQWPGHIRTVLMPHHSELVLAAFVADLAMVVNG